MSCKFWKAYFYYLFIFLSISYSYILCTLYMYTASQIINTLPDSLPSFIKKKIIDSVYLHFWSVGQNFFSRVFLCKEGENHDHLCNKIKMLLVLKFITNFIFVHLLLEYLFQYFFYIFCQNLLICWKFWWPTPINV